MCGLLMEYVINVFSKRIPSLASLHVKSPVTETPILKVSLSYLACAFPSRSLLSFVGERRKLLSCWYLF